MGVASTAPRRPACEIVDRVVGYFATRTQGLDGVSDLAGFKTAQLAAFGERSAWASVNVTTLGDIEERLRAEINTMSTEKASP